MYDAPYVTLLQEHGKGADAFEGACVGWLRISVCSHLDDWMIIMKYYLSSLCILIGVQIMNAMAGFSCMHEARCLS